MKRVHLIVIGKVQGVGFRYFCQYRAAINSITGFVRNLENGNVELEAQGSLLNIDKFINQIIKGNGFSKVSNWDLEEIPLLSDEKKFKITH